MRTLQMHEVSEVSGGNWVAVARGALAGATRGVTGGVVGMAVGAAIGVAVVLMLE